MVTTPAVPDAVAVTPTAGYVVLQLLMAAARYAATVAGVEFTFNVPAVQLVHAPEPLVNPGIGSLRLPVSPSAATVNALCLEVVINGALLPVVLINEITTPVPGDARVAVTLGFGAVIYE